MSNFCIILQYDGTKYSGWQKQGNTSNTIQGKIEDVLSKMIGCPTELHGAGRTDAGVHAKGQVANFKCNTEMSCEEICTYLNKYLPLDIRVISCEGVDERFHARLSAVGKHYRYQIDTGEKADVFERRYLAHLPKKYDVEAMRQAAQVLVGEHDFKSFCDNRHMKKSTVRRIDSIVIEEKENRLSIDFVGNGFLYHMVRIMTGTLLEVGEGKRKTEDIQRILDAKKRDAAGFLVPAQGLFLMEVFYEKNNN